MANSDQFMKDVERSMHKQWSDVDPSDVGDAGRALATFVKAIVKIVKDIKK